MASSSTRSLPRLALPAMGSGSRPVSSTTTGLVTSDSRGGRTDEQLDWNQVLGVFTDRHTRHLPSRHLAAMRRVLRLRPDGMWVGDVPFVVSLIEQAVDHINDGQQEYIDPLCALLKKLALPLHSAKAFEEARNADSIRDLLQTYAKLLLLSAPVKCAVAEAVVGFLTLGQPQLSSSPASKATQNTRRLHEQILADSNLIKDLVATLEQCIRPFQTLTLSASIPGRLHTSDSNRDDIQNYLLRGSTDALADQEAQPKPTKLNRIMSSSTSMHDLRKSTSYASVLSSWWDQAPSVANMPPAVEDQYVDEGIAKVLLTCLVAVADAELGACREQLIQSRLFEVLPAFIALELVPSMALVPHVVEVIWRLVQVDASAREQAADPAVLRELGRLIHQLFGMKKIAHKQLRNEVVSVLLIVAELPHARVYFSKLGLTQRLVQCATQEELGHEIMETNSTAGQGLSKRADKLDLELKKLLWRLITRLSSELLCLSVLVECHFIPALLVYLDVSTDKAPECVTRLAATELRDLQAAALSSLRVLSRHLVQSFIKHNVQPVLLDFVASLTLPWSQHNGVCIEDLLATVTLKTARSGARMSPAQSLQRMLPAPASGFHATSSSSNNNNNGTHNMAGSSSSPTPRPPSSTPQRNRNTASSRRTTASQTKSPRLRLVSQGGSTGGPNGPKGVNISPPPRRKHFANDQRGTPQEREVLLLAALKCLSELHLSMLSSVCEHDRNVLAAGHVDIGVGICGSPYDPGMLPSHANAASQAAARAQTEWHMGALGDEKQAHSHWSHATELTNISTAHMALLLDLLDPQHEHGDGAVSQPVVVECLLLLSMLCRVERHNRDMFRRGRGIEAVVDSLRSESSASLALASTARSFSGAATGGNWTMRPGTGLDMSADGGRDKRASAAGAALQPASATAMRQARSTLSSLAHSLSGAPAASSPPQHLVSSHDQLLEAAVFAIRSCVLGTDKSVKKFLVCDGIPALLDLLCVVSSQLEESILSCISDLCVSLPDVIPYLMEWRGPVHAVELPPRPETSHLPSLDSQLVELTYSAASDASSGGIRALITALWVRALCLDDSAPSMDPERRDLAHLKRQLVGLCESIGWTELADEKANIAEERSWQAATFHLMKCYQLTVEIREWDAVVGISQQEPDVLEEDVDFVAQKRRELVELRDQANDQAADAINGYSKDALKAASNAMLAPVQLSLNPHSTTKAEAKGTALAISAPHAWEPKTTSSGVVFGQRIHPSHKGRNRASAAAIRARQKAKEQRHAMLSASLDPDATLRSILRDDDISDLAPASGS